MNRSFASVIGCALTIAICLGAGCSDPSNDDSELDDCATDAGCVDVGDTAPSDADASDTHPSGDDAGDAIADADADASTDADANTDTGGDGAFDADASIDSGPDTDAGPPDAPCQFLSSPSGVDFGLSTLDRANTTTLTIRNCSSNDPLELHEMVLTDRGGGTVNGVPVGPFVLPKPTLPGDLPDSAATLAPGQSVGVPIKFYPPEEQSYTGELLLRSDHASQPEVRLPLTGEGTANRCPEAVARAWVSGQQPVVKGTRLNVDPQQTVQLDSSESSDDDGLVAGQEWTIIDRPAGSTSQLVPDRTAESPTLFVDTPGVYQVALVAYDDQNLPSCDDPKLIMLHATPHHDVAVELTWTTPNDQTPGDDHGSDLDLHYMHPDGTWNQAPWDIFWNNAAADWGVFGDFKDDPYLVVDDSSGDGPEFINHSGLEPGLSYSVGVHYFNANTLGDSYATVRVYVDGQLAFEKADRYLNEGKFWDVARIDSSTMMVSPVGQLYDGIP